MWTADLCCRQPLFPDVNSWSVVQAHAVPKWEQLICSAVSQIWTADLCCRHPLFPLLALLFEKCELATQSAECPSSEGFNMDIQAQSLYSSRSSFCTVVILPWIKRNEAICSRRNQKWEIFCYKFRSKPSVFSFSIFYFEEPYRTASKNYFCITKALSRSLYRYWSWDPS
jgi:hypothetical protein